MCRLWREKKTAFPSISSLIGRAFSIFRQKMDGPSPSEKDIKVSIPAPKLLFTVLQKIFPKWKKEKYFLSWEKWSKIIKTWNAWFQSNIINHHPHVHFIRNNRSIVLTLWKWGETSSTTSLLLIRTSSTSGFRNGSVFTSSGRILCSNEEWFRNDSEITTTRQSLSSSDVTRVVATEHVRNKYSLLESIHLKSVNLRTASI